MRRRSAGARRLTTGPELRAACNPTPTTSVRAGDHSQVRTRRAGGQREWYLWPWQSDAFHRSTYNGLQPKLDPARVARNRNLTHTESVHGRTLRERQIHVVRARAGPLIET